jgi:hypothetical protein
MFNLDTKYHIEYRNRYNPEDLMKAQAIWKDQTTT